MTDSFSSEYANYMLKDTIGFGAASIVYAAVHAPVSPPSSVDAQTAVRNPILCAIKISSRYPNVEQWLEEVRIISSCRHPNVLQIYAAFTIPPEHCQVAIVTPLIAGGSLLSLMAWRATLPSAGQPSGLFRSLSGRRYSAPSPGVMTEHEIRAVLRQVLRGLGYLHNQGIIHRDIKAGNILLDPDGTVLLADLGVGARTNAHSEKDANTGLIGSPCWMAPEVITGSLSTSKSDIWSLGITMIELSTGLAPLAHLPAATILTQIVDSPAPNIPPSIGTGKAFLSFLSSCLVKSPAVRADMSQLERHPFLRNARKPAWLAGSLLKGVPPVTHRQEIRRVPCPHSPAHSVISWNFNATPSVSTLSTAMRTTHRLPRSPSASTSSSGRSRPLAGPRKRSVSISSVGYSVPSSPKALFSRVSWAMTSANRTSAKLGSGKTEVSRAEIEPERRGTTNLTTSLGASPTGPDDHAADTIYPALLPSLTSLADLDTRRSASTAETQSHAVTATQNGVSGKVSPPTRRRKGLFGRRWGGQVSRGGAEDSRIGRTLRMLRGLA